MMLANREMIPSMLDPEFEDDAPTPGRMSQDQNHLTASLINGFAANPQARKNRMQLANNTKGASASVPFKKEPVSDYN